MPNDQELISQLRLAMEQARRCAAQLREAGWEVCFVLAESEKDNPKTLGQNAMVLVERTTREKHTL